MNKLNGYSAEELYFCHEEETTSVRFMDHIYERKKVPTQINGSYNQKIVHMNE